MYYSAITNIGHSWTWYFITIHMEGNIETEGKLNNVIKDKKETKTQNERKQFTHQQKEKPPSNGKNLMNVDYNLLSVLLSITHMPPVHMYEYYSPNEFLHIFSSCFRFFSLAPSLPHFAHYGRLLLIYYYTVLSKLLAFILNTHTYIKTWKTYA